MKTQRKIGGFVILLVAVIAFGTSGCKSSKKAQEAAAAKARMEQQAANKARQEELARKQAEEKINADKANRELEEQARRNAEAKSTADTPATQKLEQYFTSIASSSSTTAANSSIHEALTLFASEDTPVLIVISEEGGQKDYDKPTTIKAYLNYLKDQRKNPNRVGSVQFNDAGRIKELELLKENGLVKP